jgi:hypothetical protein
MNAEEIAVMSTQERIALLGVDEASKYIPKGIRSNGYPASACLAYEPALTEEGGKYHTLLDNARKMSVKLESMDIASKIPREFVLPTVSFKKNKPAKKVTKSTFTKSDITSKKRKKKV